MLMKAHSNGSMIDSKLITSFNFGHEKPVCVAFRLCSMELISVRTKTARPIGFDWFFDRFHSQRSCRIGQLARIRLMLSPRREEGVHSAHAIWWAILNEFCGFQPATRSSFKVTIQYSSENTHHAFRYFPRIFHKNKTNPNLASKYECSNSNVISVDWHA